LSQVLWVEMICIVSALAAGSWGILVAFWREKTLQTLATSVLGCALFICLLEAGLLALGHHSAASKILSGLDPYRALISVLNPLSDQPDAAKPVVDASASVLSLAGLAFLLTSFTVWKVRVWNPSQAAFEQAANAALAQESATPEVHRKVHRRVWDLP